MSDPSSQFLILSLKCLIPRYQLLQAFPVLPTSPIYLLVCSWKFDSLESCNNCKSHLSSLLTFYASSHWCDHVFECNCRSLVQWWIAHSCFITMIHQIYVKTRLVTVSNKNNKSGSTFLFNDYHFIMPLAVPCLLLHALLQSQGDSRSFYQQSVEPYVKNDLNQKKKSGTVSGHHQTWKKVELLYSLCFP